MRKQYKREDLGRGVRGKFYQPYRKGTNLVALSPDVAAAFPSSDAVNEALREVMRFATSSARLTIRASGRVTKRRAA
jgi:hypothetical protein